MTAAAKAHLTVQRDGDGRYHAYVRCAGGRAPVTLTVAALTGTDPALICRCLRPRYDAYTTDLAA